MSISDQLNGLDIDPSELAEDIAKGTIPGGNNEPYIRGLQRSNEVLPDVIEDLNNWFHIVDVRVLGENHVGIPMRYRWTIVRWARQDMDSWLEDRGWVNDPHLNADSRHREENELEARYRKVFDEVLVDCNFLVEFPDVVFEKMNRGDIDDLKERKRKRENRSFKLREIINERRE